MARQASSGLLHLRVAWEVCYSRPTACVGCRISEGTGFRSVRGDVPIGLRSGWFGPPRAVTATISGRSVISCR